jgi:phage shock protein C
MVYGSLPLESANSLFLHCHFVYMKRLYRSGKEQMLGGVCGGLGEHFDIDPTIIRLVWVVVTLISLGIGIIVYLAAWVIIPASPDESTQQTLPTA